MNTEQEQDFYRERLRTFGPTPHGVGWAKDGSTQAKRFEVLLEMAHCQTGEVLLDAGCGVGHLLEYLPRCGISTTTYVGVDQIPQMIRYARERHPSYHFECHDLLTYRDPVDVVVANGTFALGTAEGAKRVVTHLFRLARRVLVLNVLTTWGGGPQTTVDLVWEPPQFLQFCSTLTHRLALRHDYLPSDMTVALWKT